MLRLRFNPSSALLSLLVPLSHLLIQALGKLGLLSNLRSLSVKYVYRNRDYYRNASQDRSRILKRSSGDVLIHRSGIKGSYTRQEVSGKIISSGC